MTIEVEFGPALPGFHVWVSIAELVSNICIFLIRKYHAGIILDSGKEIWGFCPFYFCLNSTSHFTFFPRVNRWDMYPLRDSDPVYKCVLVSDPNYIFIVNFLCKSGNTFPLIASSSNDPPLRIRAILFHLELVN